MKAKEITKYQNQQSIKISRSQINFAPYNPRKISEKALSALKKNIKTVGLLGGLVWNKKTGNLVSGHQRINALDQIHKYNPDTKENDYIVIVEVVDMELSKEKEQNIFMNSTTVQGEFDNEKLALILPDIDYKAAGLDYYDISLIQTESPTFDLVAPNDMIKEDMEKMDKPYEERKEAIKEAKKAHKEAAEENWEGEPYFSVAFDNYENKVEFCMMFGIDPEMKFIKGEVLFENILNKE